MKKRITCWLAKWHRDQEGNLLVISAIFVMVLVIVLTVVINLAHVTHEKIQAQNAADAAALTGGVWQIRGLAFIQSMNNLVYISDMAASFGLNVAVGGSLTAVATAKTGVGYIIGQVIGNGGLLVCMGAHGFSHFILVPLRDVMNASWPVVSALAASEMANRNQARPIIASATDMLSGLAGEYAARKRSGQDWSDDSWEEPEYPLKKEASWLWELIRNIPLYSLGLEVQVPKSMDLASFIPNLDDFSLLTDVYGTSGGEAAHYHPNHDPAEVSAMKPPSIKLAGLHLQRTTDPVEKGWPLVMPDIIIDAQLLFCTPLKLGNAAKKYFKKAAAPWQETMDQFEQLMDELGKEDDGQESSGKGIDVAIQYAERFVDQAVDQVVEATYWKHPYYESKDVDARGFTTLPPSTWITGGGVDDDAYKRRTALWHHALGGLGAAKITGGYGQLSSIASASVSVRADAVGKHPKVIRGWVDLTPVRIIEEQSDSRRLGICH